MLKAIVTDIEGTTSSIRFVKEVLFPYSIQALPAYIEQHKDEPELKSLLEQAALAAGFEQPASIEPASLIPYLLDWIREDKKVTALKAIQGLVWEAGYRAADYQAHIYADAYQALKQWHRQGIPIYVYSSGSVYAQKLFFSYSEYGDISEFFSGYFDTTIGPKRVAESYTSIARAIELEPQAVLFLSDSLAEIEAAAEVGMQTCWLVRAQDTTAHAAEVKASRYRTADSFEQISIA